MSARKLQQEMDRVFKRVAEGCAVFDGIYNKLQNASNQSQKEKLEQDLKREIKKLQKLRDQIKTWIASNDVRDKKQLMEQRRLIENDMERFKAVEREVKTKAYSKEGLSRSNDPYAKEKQEATDFIQQKVEELEQQIEGLEEEQDQLQSSTKKGKKDHSKQDRINEIDHSVERHKWHIAKMEIMIVMIESDKLAPEAVMDLQEDINYYVESNQEVDFAEDEAIYDELNLLGEDDNEIVETIIRDDTYTLEDLAQDLSKEAAKEAAQKEKEEKEKERRDKEKGKDKAATPSSSASPPVSTVSPEPQASAVPAAAASTPAPAPPTASSSAAPSAAATPAPTLSSAPFSTPLSAGPGAATPSYSPGPSNNVGTGRDTGRTPSPSRRSQSPSTPVIHPLPPPSVPASKSTEPYRKGAHLAQGGATAPTPSLAQRSISKSAGGSPSPVNAGNSFQQQQQQQQQISTTRDYLSQATQTAANAAPASTASSAASSLVSSAGSGAEQVQPISSMLDVQTLPPGLQDLVHCLDGARQRLSDPEATLRVPNITQLIHNSFLNTPDALMSDQPRYYHPQNPYPTPDYYPQESLPSLEDPAVFREMHVDTLFYIFYYCQNTHQQYLAAKELKNRSWRFHKQFLTWFQRQEDPQLIMPDYEEGTYRFFDFEGSWVQRRKTNFKFEFKYLENEI